MKNRIFVISLLLTAFLGMNMAYGQKPNQENRASFKKAKKALHQESRAYTEENILPVMQAQRASLDLMLSAGEQQELDAIRTELEAMRKEQHARMKAFHQKNGGERPQQRPEPTAEQMEEMRAQKKAHRQLMTRAWTIADAHEASIYKLLDEVKDDKVQWKNDLEQIRKEQLGDLQKEQGADLPMNPHHRGFQEKGGHPEQGMPHPGMHKGPRGEDMMGHLRKITSEPVAFLLWDGSLRDRPERGPREADQDLTIFPNPASKTNQLRYTVEKDGLVTISLLNAEGVTLKTLSSKTQQAGDYTESFTLDNLKAGTYYYKVALPGSRQVKRFVIE